MRATNRGQGPLLQGLDVMVGFVGARLAREQSFLWEAATRATNRGQGPLLQKPMSRARRAPTSRFQDRQNLGCFFFQQRLIRTRLDIQPHHRLRIRHTNIEAPVGKLEAVAVRVINV